MKIKYIYFLICFLWITGCGEYRKGDYYKSVGIGNNLCNDVYCIFPEANAGGKRVSGFIFFLIPIPIDIELNSNCNGKTKFWVQFYMSEKRRFADSRNYREDIKRFNLKNVTATLTVYNKAYEVDQSYTTTLTEPTGKYIDGKWEDFNDRYLIFPVACNSLNNFTLKVDNVYFDGKKQEPITISFERKVRTFYGNRYYYD